MDRYLHAFDAAEQARIQGDNETAIRLYEEAADLSEQSSAFDPVALHHMWGVALTSTGQYEEALKQLMKASRLADTARNSKTWSAISRDMALLYLAKRQLGFAHHEIDHALNYLPPGDPVRITERGACIGVKARIKLGQGDTHVALELFGTADVLLQRSQNRHFELYNLLHFMEAIIKHCPIYNGDDEARSFTQAQTPRLRALAEVYGGPPHRARADKITEAVFADVEG
jgi:tetratricopeptide (TPR) repeat protein